MLGPKTDGPKLALTVNGAGTCEVAVVAAAQQRAGSVGRRARTREDDQRGRRWSRVIGGVGCRTASGSPMLDQRSAARPVRGRSGGCGSGWAKWVGAPPDQDARCVAGRPPLQS